MMSVNNVFKRILSNTQCNQYKIRNFCNSAIITRENKQTSPDILMNKFKYANNTKEVLDTFTQHKDVMNSKHIMQALRSVFTLQKEGRSELSTKSIINSKKFAQLCGKLKTLAGTIDSYETIDALKVVTYVGVPKNSTIVLVLLQLLRHNLNDLNLQQIVFLDFLLGHYADIPLAEALRIALPIVFDIQLPTKMGHENIQSLCDYLRFASKNRLSDKSVDLILSKILNCKDKYESKTARTIIWALCDLEPRPCFEPLLKQNFNVLVEGINDIPFEDLDFTLKKLAVTYIKHQYPPFRSKIFCDSFVNYLIERNIGFKDSVYSMKKLVQLTVVNRDLIDYVSNQIIKNTKNVNEDFYVYYVLLKYLAKTDYRPQNWNQIISRINKIKLNNMDKIDILKISVVLAYHQIFKEELVYHIFDQNFENTLSKRNINSYLTLYYSLKLFRPDLIPKNFKPEKYVDTNVLKDFPFEGALYSAFGGENYVKSGCFSKEGIFIDHVIVFRKGGYPVSINFTSKFIEDQIIPEDNEIVLVMCLSSEAYTEEHYLRKAFSIRMEVLEKLGYTVVPINLESWKSLLDHEKIPYLVQNVKNKLRLDKSMGSYA